MTQEEDFVKKANINIDEAIANIDKAIQEMVEKGIVEVSYDEQGHQTIKLTELGWMIQSQDMN